MEKTNDERLLEKMGELSLRLRRQMFGGMEEHGGPEGRGPHERGFGGPEGHRPHDRGFGGPEGHRPHDRGFGGPEGHGPHERGFGGPEGRGPQGRGFGGSEGHGPQSRAAGGPEGRGPQGRAFGGPEGRGPYGRGFGSPEEHGPQGRAFGSPEGHGSRGRGFEGPEGYDPRGGRFGGPEDLRCHGRDFDVSEERPEDTESDLSLSSSEHADDRENRMGNFGRGPFEGRRPPMARERILRIIGEEEGISQKKLAEYFRIRPQSLSELLGKLEKDGYVTRRQNEQDKRETLVYLTEQGKQRAEEVEAARSQQTAALFSPLTDEEKETLIALLEKLIPSENE